MVAFETSFSGEVGVLKHRLEGAKDVVVRFASFFHFLERLRLKLCLVAVVAHFAKLRNAAISQGASEHRSVDARLSNVAHAWVH